MSHFAIVTPPLYSHLQAMQALAQVLIARGHKITFIQPASAVETVSDRHIAVEYVGATNAATSQPAGSPGEISLFRLIGQMSRTTEMLCRELPDALNRLSVDGLIVDQMEAAGGLVAEALGLPFVSVACALPVNRESGLPLPVMPFGYATDKRTLTLYDTSSRIYDWLMRSHDRVIARNADKFGLTPRKSLDQCLSPLAQISQTVPLLDFPRRALPACFHHVGPLRSTKIASAESAWPVSPLRPFVFASLGTLQGHRFGLFKTIARACRSLDVQLLIAHCGGLGARQAEALLASGANWVTDFADQPQVLQQAQAVITHGGLNTVIDAVNSATPILAMPIAFDQPGVAARVEWNGLGRRVCRFSSSSTIAQNLTFLLKDEGYRRRLAAASEQLQQAGGAARAADIIEQVFKTQHVRLEATG